MSERTLYFGGPILTMLRDHPRAKALLVENGQIAAIGAADELRKLAPDANMVDLQGRTLMPAFVDGHSHMSGVGQSRRQCDLTDCPSPEELLERIRRYRQQRDLTHGEPIVARGFDQSVMGSHPTAALLDSLGFDNPIACIHQSGHTASYNTVAMRACGVDDSWVCPPGGYAERDAHGHLTGYFEEKAQAPFSKLFSTVTPEQFAAGVLEAQDYYFSKGITTIQDGSGHGPEKLSYYRKLALENKLKADIVLYIAPDPEDPDFWEAAIAECGNRVYRNHLKIGGVKLMLDGSPQARTAWMRQPYEGETEYVGYPVRTDEWVRAVLDNCIAAGLQPIAHCNGDAAAQQFLDQWEAAVKAAGHGTELRPIMIHAQTVGFDQLDRMAALGMHPSFFVGHCWFWGDTHLKNFGRERGMRISPMRAALDRGLVPNLHQDSPVTRPEMLHSIWCAVNRITRSGVSIGPEQAVTPEEALRAATWGGAFSYFEENSKGILKPGAVADLVILDRDPTAVDPMDIRDICVLETIKDGKTVYRA